MAGAIALGICSAAALAGCGWVAVQIHRHRPGQRG
jgi:hypothetical protein